MTIGAGCGLGNLRANGHPSGGPWRQFHCTSCQGYFLETHGTIFHGKQAAVELIVRVLACLAEGLGIRATARVFEVDPNTVLHWLVEAAEQLRAFSAYFLCDLHLEQLQLDELYAVLRDLKAGEISDDEAIKRLERSPSWVWTAMDPKSKLLVVVDVGSRTLAMAQRVVHQVTQVLAPGCVPLFLTDGLKDYGTALLTHFGHVDAPRTSPGQRPEAQAALDAAARAALRASGEVVPAPTHRRGQAPRGVRHPAGHRAGLGEHVAGPSIPPLSSGSTSTSASAWRRSGAGSIRSARAKRACGISWRCSRSITTLSCPTPVCASRCRCPKPPTAVAQRRCGGRVHRRWRRD